MHANKSSDLLAWWTLDKATRSRTHASLRPANEQVSSRFRAGLGPASVMDFGLYKPVMAKWVPVLKKKRFNNLTYN